MPNTKAPASSEPADRASSQPERADPAEPTRPARSAGAVDLRALVDAALELRGVRYRDGGADRNGFDCSGFTQFVFAKYGVLLPRSVREQFYEGRPIKNSPLEPGDLIFFSTTAAGPSHVAISLGGGEFVHAPSSKGVVRVERLQSSYWSSRLVGVRRIISS